MRERLFSNGWRGTLVNLGLALGLATSPLTSASSAGSDPQTTVGGFYGVLLSNMQQGRALGESGRYARLAPVIVRDFDIPTMTRLAIGQRGQTLAPAQQQQLQAAFAHYVTATYADRFDSYSGEQLQVTGERPNGNDVIVQTKLVKSNGETTRLDYLMHADQGSWRVSDIYLDGTISQLAVHRSEFQSILQREGVESLVTALNRKVDLLRSAARPS
jgi:phospholipid transport system substrate-binding protein